jgi:hypothetical protein
MVFQFAADFSAQQGREVSNNKEEKYRSAEG